MTTQGHNSSGNASPLARRVADDATASQIAEAMVTTWQAIDAALAPILGSRGVAALYQRSVVVSSNAHAWLADLHEGVDGRIDLVAMKSLFAQQHDGHASSAASALLQTFHELLTSLVGDSLTNRLLHSVWSAAPVPSSQSTSP